MRHTKTIGDLIKETFQQEFETFNTNSSLMVYTSGVNRTNIDHLRLGEVIVEDRTMNAQEALNEVKQEMAALQKKLEDEVRKVGSTLITADLSAYANAPRVRAEIFTPEWDKEREAQEQYVKAVRKGNIPQEVQVTLKPLGTLHKEVHLTSELMDAIDEFTDYVEAEYAYKLQELSRKAHSFRKIRDAERSLDRS